MCGCDRDAFDVRDAVGARAEDYADTPRGLAAVQPLLSLSLSLFLAGLLLSPSL